MRATLALLLLPATPATAADYDTVIADRSTFEKPRQYAVGVSDVFVNGAQVLKGGEPTGAKPGRFLKGAGFGKCPG
jgi:N-acyl-D-amino-acid deacylase